MISLARDDASVTARWEDVELFRYVYRSDDPQAESPPITGGQFHGA